MTRIIGILWGLVIRLFTRSTRYISSVPSTPPLNVDWVAKRISAARNAGLLQLLLLAATATMAFQALTLWSDANDALSWYVEYIAPTLPYNADGNTSISDWLSTVNPASSPTTTNWYSVSLLGDRRWSIKVDTLPQNTLAAWLKRDGTQSCTARTVAILHMTSTMPSINTGSGFFNPQYLVANGTAARISIYSGAAFADMMSDKYSDFARNALAEFCRYNPLSRSDLQARIRGYAAMFGITSEHVDSAMIQLMAKIAQPTATIPLLSISVSGSALFWCFAGLSVVIGAWSAGHFRILAAQTPLDGREPWHLVDPIVFPDRRLLAKPARVIELCVGLLFEILCAATPLLLVVFAIAVSYDATIKQYPLLKYLSSDWYAGPINIIMSDDAQTIVICIAAMIAILQCIWVAVIIYHAIRKSFTKTVPEVE